MRVDLDTTSPLLQFQYQMPSTNIYRIKNERMCRAKFRETHVVGALRIGKARDKFAGTRYTWQLPSLSRKRDFIPKVTGM